MEKKQTERETKEEFKLAAYFRNIDRTFHLLFYYAQPIFEAAGFYSNMAGNFCGSSFG